MSVIAISRGSLRTATRLAEGLSEKLGTKIIKREQVIKAAEKYGLAETGLREKDILEQHPPGFWEKYSKARKHYLTCFKAALLDYVLQDSIIYIGNLAHILLNDIPFVLCVRVNAPLENRVKILVETEGLSRDDAIKKIKETDIRRRRWVQFLYDADVRDTYSFDLVLNIGKMTLYDGIDLVAEEAQKEQFQADEKSMKIVRDMHLSTVAEAYLMHFPGTYSYDFEVTADSATGSVIVGGTVATENIEELKKDIDSALADITIVKNVNVEIKTL